MAKIFKGVPYSGTLPATLTGTKAGYLHSYKIYGNTVQNGTPTPENPIEPSECGERTENLFNLDRQPSDTWTYDQLYYLAGAVANAKTVYPNAAQISISGNGITVYNRNGQGAGFIVPVKPNTTYTLSYNMNILIGSSSTSCVLNTIDTNDSLGTTWAIYDNANSSTFTTLSDTQYIIILLRVVNNTATYSNIMLVEGSTALPYEPYGYKLPLLSDSTPVDIYLGESQTTRRIKKLVLTGTENWGYNGNNHTAYLTTPDSFLGEGVSVISTHYTAVSNKTAYTQLSDNQCCLRANGNYLWVRDDDYSTVEDFKAYLAAQYAAGTPVTVWYVLETPETGTLNEPLRKIGDYADTIDSTQTSTQIPTSANSTTISWAGDELAPSQFDSIAEWVSATPKIYTNGAWVDAQTYTYTNGAWVADN